MDRKVAMRIVKSTLRYVFAGFFVFAGIHHFRDPDFFLKIMPDYIPQELHAPAVYVSGVFEIALGIILAIPQTTRLAAWGLIALLVAVFPANIFVYQHQEVIPGFSPTAHLLRLPVQGVIIALAYWYTRPDGP
jgi:uncharacterized membrane protein